MAAFSASQSAPSQLLTQTPGKTGVRVPPGHVLVSEKWRGTELVTVLQGVVSVLYDDSIGVLDFLLSSNTGVIYVSESDLVSGTAFRRKLVKLRKANNVRGIVLAEKTPISKQYFPSLQKFTVLELGLVLLVIVNQNEAGGLLAQMTLAEGRPQMNVLRQKRKPPPIDASILATMQLVPKLGAVKARALLERFKSIKGISDASTEELAGVVGQANAQQVKAFFTQDVSSSR